MPPDPTPEKRPGESTTEWPGFGRRPLLKALGVGATVTVGSGLATARQDESRIHPVFGYSVQDADEIPDDLQPDHEVELGGAPPDPETGRPPSFFFDPVGLHVSPGDVVQFSVATNDHTVTAYHPAHGFQLRVPEEVPPFSSPVVPGGGAWLYRFDREGVYDVYCGPHHAFGMVMRIVVGDVTDESVPDYVDTFEGSEDPPLLAPFDGAFFERELNAYSDRNDDVEWVWLTPVAVFETDALDPVGIRDAGSVPFSAVREELDGDTQTTTE